MRQTGTETEATLKEATEEGVTIVIPELIGTYKVVLKQEGKEQELGSIEIGSSVLIKNGMEIMPRKVEMIVYECVQRGDLDTIYFVTDENDMLKFTRRWERAHLPTSGPHVYDFVYDGNLPIEVKHLHGDPKPIIWEGDDDEEDYSLTKSINFDEWTYNDNGSASFTYDSDNRLSKANITTMYGDMNSATYTYINGYLNKVAFVDGYYGDMTDAMFIVEDGLLKTVTQTYTMNDPDATPDTKTLTFNYSGEYLNSANVDFFDFLFFGELTFMSYDWSWGGYGENCGFLLGIMGNRFKQLPTEIISKKEGSDTEYRRQLEYYTTDGYITLINITEKDMQLDWESGGYTETEYKASYKIFYEEE